MKKIFLGVILLVSIVLLVYFYFSPQKKSLISPLGKLKEKSLSVYSFNSLKKIQFPKNSISLGKKISENENIITQMFYYSVPQSPNADVQIKVSGVINLPKKPGNYPIIVMLRGYVPDEMYQPGVGTQHAAEVFAKNGFITLAPDFLGAGESASPSADPLEARFQTYTTILTLFSSLSNLDYALNASYSGSIKGDLSKIGIWAHSNGGQIALSVLAISGVDYPMVLWAPVSKSFPYSILYYTDEVDDQGKTLRKLVADFEKDYSAEEFSFTSYLSWIKAPIQINQGESDQEVPVWWSEELAASLKKEKISTQYFSYPGADHNMLPSQWTNVVNNNMLFYNTSFKK